MDSRAYRTRSIAPTIKMAPSAVALCSSAYHPTWDSSVTSTKEPQGKALHPQLVYAELLRGQGCQVALARTGAEAVTQVRATRPDVALVDIQIPELVG